MRARNYLASVATFGHDNAGRPFSHLMFIDADISFHPEYFFKMLKANLPIRCVAIRTEIIELEVHRRGRQTGPAGKSSIFRR
jgi:hypothetical protein